MNVQGTAEQVDQLKHQYNTLMNADGEGNVDFANLDLSDDDKLKARDLMGKIQLAQSHLAADRQAERLEADKVRTEAILAERRGVSVDEHANDKRELSAAYHAMLHDEVGRTRGWKPRQTDEQREMLDNVQVQNVVTGTDNTGGLTVMPHVLEDLQVELNHVNNLRQYATVTRIANGIDRRFPIADETAGVAPAKHTEDDSTVTVTLGSQPIFKMVDIKTEVLDSRANAISEEFLQDTEVENFEIELRNILVDIMGSDEAEKMVSPVAASGATEVKSVFVGATKQATLATKDVLTLNECLNLVGALRPRHRSRAWLMLSRKAWAQLAALQYGSGGTPIWSPGLPGASGRAGANRFFNTPFFESDAMSGAAAANQPYLAVGDFSRFRILDVASYPRLKMYTDSVFASNHMIGVQVFNRLGSRLVTAQTGANCPIQWLSNKA